MPFKTFTTGELVTAADANLYWGQQAIAIYPDAVARNAGIPVPVVGQHAYLTDTHTMTWWDGSRWAGDTGWRDLTLSNGWAGDLYVRRVGGWVTVQGRLDPAGQTGVTVTPMTSGFRPARWTAQTLGFPVMMLAAGNSPTTARLNVTDDLTVGMRIQPVVPTAQFDVNGSWLTDDPWPATLPGSPAPAAGAQPVLPFGQGAT
jgi:hypothetical protein